jgi:hypothetical protein
MVDFGKGSASVFALPFDDTTTALCRCLEQGARKLSMMGGHVALAKGAL